VAVGDARRREDERVPGGELLRVIDPLLVAMAHRGAPGPLLVAPVPEPRLDLAAETAQRGRRQDALRGAPDPHHRVHAGALDRAADRGGEVAVADQLDPSAGRPDLLDQRLVARPLQDHDGDVADAPAELRRDPGKVLARRQADVDAAGRDRTDAQLVEVRVRRVHEATLLRRGEDRDRAGLAVRDEVGAFEGVDGDVDGDVDRRVVAFAGRRPASDRLADPEHGRLVALALADDDPAVELDLVHRPAHRLDGRSIRLVLLAP